MTLAGAVRAEVAAIGELLVRLRRDVHAHPEPAFQEVRTAGLAAAHCAPLGMRVRTGVGGTGVLADLSSGRPGPTVLIRVDMDALPVQENDDARPYRSTVPGVMHACGHDGHVAIGIGVATVLAHLRSRWAGRIRLCFQPAEETDEGAARMIDDGALDSVSAAVGLHLQAGLAVGTIGIGAGPQWSGSDELRIEIRGSGGHAGDPWATVDPVAVAAETVLALRTIARTRPMVNIAITQLTAGTAPNVTPETVGLGGTVRAMAEADRAWLLAEIEHTAHRIAAEYGAAAEVSFGVHCPALVCDAPATEAITAALLDHFPPGTVTGTEPTTATDDMARFLRAVPGCYFRVGASDLDAGPVHPHHHPRFDIDERCLPIAVNALTRAALTLLEIA